VAHFLVLLQVGQQGVAAMQIVKERKALMQCR
jgi:hypothetical protein